MYMGFFLYEYLKSAQYSLRNLTLNNNMKVVIQNKFQAEFSRVPQLCLKI